MKRFAVWAIDRPGALADRARVREAHRARLRDPAPHAVTVVLAGPLFDATGAQMCGTMLVVDAVDGDAVRRFVDDDPYVREGVYAHIDIRPWLCGLGPLSTIAKAQP